jgi:multiple sugar transport system substrate-binding protein
MTEFRFSVISDDSQSSAEIELLLKEFQNAAKINIKTTRLTWDGAWQVLLRTAIEGKGEDISQVGSTWAPTLAALDSLRPFSESEVRSMGGPLVFVPAAWNTVRLEGKGDVWAIPWSVYTFVLFYRRDLLQKAGIDEKTAFATPADMLATFKALQRADITPWTIPTDTHYLDLPHIASSWARAYGGDFINPDGKRPIFNTPDSRRGLMEFFELYPFIPDHLRGLDYEKCLEEFFQKGSSAVLIAGAETYSDMLTANELAEDLHSVIGVAPVPGISWIGGDHIVVWKTVRTDPMKEAAAVDLIRSLTSVENQVRLSRETTILPVRLDAYPQLEFQPAEMRVTLEKIMQEARPHPPMRLWRRIESMLVDMLGDIARSALQSAEGKVTEIVEAKLAEYEKRFSLILGG